MTSNSTVITGGAREANIISMGNEKLQFTVMSSCMADGTKLHPYMVFKRETLSKGVEFPQTVVVRANEKKFMNDGTVMEWVKLVWCLRTQAALQPCSVLVLDAFRGHLTQKVKEKLCDVSTDMLVIPESHKTASAT